MEKPKKYKIKLAPVEAIRYTGPASVMRMLHAWGSMGFNNSPEGLHITMPSGHFLIKRGSWVVKPHANIRKFFAFDNDAFKRMFKGV